MSLAGAARRAGLRRTVRVLTCPRLASAERRAAGLVRLRAELRTLCRGFLCAEAWRAGRCEALAAAAAALLCARALCAVCPLAETAISVPRRNEMKTVRTMGSTRRIESTISVRRAGTDFECLGGYGFVR